MKSEGVSELQLRRAMLAAGIYTPKSRLDALIAGEITPHLSTAAVLAKAVNRKVDDLIVEQDAA